MRRGFTGAAAELAAAMRDVPAFDDAALAIARLFAYAGPRARSTHRSTAMQRADELVAARRARQVDAPRGVKANWQRRRRRRALENEERKERKKMWKPLAIASRARHDRLIARAARRRERKAKA